MVELENKLKQHQKLIFQLNDLLSLVIERIGKNEQFTGIENEINIEFEKLKNEVYHIKGNIVSTKYNCN